MERNSSPSLKLALTATLLAACSPDSSKTARVADTPPAPHHFALQKTQNKLIAAGDAIPFCRELAAYDAIQEEVTAYTDRYENGSRGPLTLETRKYFDLDTEKNETVTCVYHREVPLSFDFDNRGRGSMSPEALVEAVRKALLTDEHLSIREIGISSPTTRTLACVPYFEDGFSFLRGKHGRELAPPTKFPPDGFLDIAVSPPRGRITLSDKSEVQADYRRIMREAREKLAKVAALAVNPKSRRGNR